MPVKKKKRQQQQQQQHKKKKKIDNDLAEIYYNIGGPDALSSAELLYQQAKSQLPYNISRNDIVNFLKRQQAYTVHRRVISRKFPRRRIRVTTLFNRWDADLVDLQDLSQWNDGYKYILLIIDAFSKYIWARRMKTKASETTSQAFADILKDTKPNKPVALYTDQGTEFLGSPFQKLLKQKSIHHRLCTGEEFHCPFVERVIRTVKRKLFMWLAYKRTRRWIDVLSDIVDSYNKTMHSVTQMRPEEVNEQNSIKTYMNMYYNGRNASSSSSALVNKKKKPKFKKGQHVRILKPKEPFTKGYIPQYTWEVFQIEKVIPGSPPAYSLQDLNGERIENALFYEPELSPVDSSQLTDESYPIREILARKTTAAGVKMIKVWWQGFPKKEATWIKEDDLLTQE